MEGFRITEYESVISTNDLVRKAIENGEPEGLAICARSQDGGKGRRGNCWSSPEGGLYISILLDPGKQASEIPTLGLVAALSVCEVLEAYLPNDSDTSFGIKWPNDVIVADKSEGPSIPFRKICGISTELVHGKICLGVGVNIFRPSDLSAVGVSARSMSRNVPAYLEDFADGSWDLNVGDVRDGFLEAFAGYYGLWSAGTFADLAEAVNAVSFLNGKDVVIEPWNIEGTVQNIASDGSLVLIESTTGDQRNIYEGSVRLKTES